MEDAETLTVMVRVILPNIRSAVLSASFLAVALVLGEFTIASLLNRDNLQVGINLLGKRDAQMSIWRSIASFIRAQGGEYVFDYIPIDDEPPRSRLGQWLSDLRHRLTNPPPPFAYDERTRQDVVADLIEAGFSQVEAIDTRMLARSWSLPHPDVPTRTIIYHCRCR